MVCKLCQRDGHYRKTCSSFREENLEEMTKAELEAMCAERSERKSGSKGELVGRLMSWKSRQYVKEEDGRGGRQPSRESSKISIGDRRVDHADVRRMQIRVANVKHSRFDKANWKDVWLRYSGVSWPSRCQILGCGQDATLGAHMYVDGQVRGINWIVPTCDPHNHQRDLECADNFCPRWVKTKVSVIAMAFEEHPSVTQAQLEDPLFGPFSVEVGSHLRLVNAHVAQGILSGRGEDKVCFLMLSASWCHFCKRLQPKFEKYASRIREPCYIVECPMDDDWTSTWTDGVPTVFMVNSARKRVEDITSSVWRTR